MEDIPQALRDFPEKRTGKFLKRYRLSKKGKILFSLAALILGTSILAAIFFRPSSSPSVVTSPSPLATNNSNESNSSEEKIENILGHLPYIEAPSSELKPITSDGRIKMRSVAAEKFLAMQKAAQAEGINLYIISGFRSVKEQNYLFFQVKEERGQITSKRAEVSAPPGYSEHHTGYAIDIGDGNTPATNLSPSFENTPAFKWLEKNAPRYSFELSFPRDNLQGVSYEPWHWRFVGDSQSLETFYKAQSLQKPLKKVN